jgi:hypothetical protein
MRWCRLTFLPGKRQRNLLGHVLVLPTGVMEIELLLASCSQQGHRGFPTRNSWKLRSSRSFQSIGIRFAAANHACSQANAKHPTSLRTSARSVSRMRGHLEDGPMSTSWLHGTGRPQSHADRPHSAKQRSSHPSRAQDPQRPRSRRTELRLRRAPRQWPLV